MLISSLLILPYCYISSPLHAHSFIVPSLISSPISILAELFPFPKSREFARIYTPDASLILNCGLLHLKINDATEAQWPHYTSSLLIKESVRLFFISTKFVTPWMNLLNSARNLGLLIKKIDPLTPLSPNASYRYLFSYYSSVLSIKYHHRFIKLHHSSSHLSINLVYYT